MAGVSARELGTLRRGQTIALSLVAALAAGLVCWKLVGLAAARAPAAATPAAVPVTAAAAKQENVPAIVPALGTVLSQDIVNVMPRVNGQITQIYFKQGDQVTANQPLFLIDPRPYQAALEQAQGQLAHDQAVLAEARMDLARYRRLEAQNSIATQTEQDQAFVVGQDAGTVKLDEANLATAALNLSYCHIDAPIAGLHRGAAGRSGQLCDGVEQRLVDEQHAIGGQRSGRGDRRDQLGGRDAAW